MRVIFVTPSELSSGEAITVLHMAEDVARHGGEYACLASEFTARFLRPRLGVRVKCLSADGDQNRRLWDDLLRTLRPNAVVFADYPYLFFSNSIAPLANERWIVSLDSVDAVLITLDHLGYAQGVKRVYYGPPHLSLHTEVTPALPPSMLVLLPCPMNEPGPVQGRLGSPFRYLVPRLDWEEGTVRKLRADSGGRSQRLVLHAVPTWAWQIARKWALPHYASLSEVFEQYLGNLPVPVRVVSINGGGLLRPSRSPGLQIENAGFLSSDEYDRLLVAADLVITDNAVSSVAGRAVCALRPVVHLHNTRRLVEIVKDRGSWACALALAMERARLGAVFPFEVFPLWDAKDLALLGLFNGNSMDLAVEKIEMFGGEGSRHRFLELLTDDTAQADLRRRQQVYVDRVSALPAPTEIMESLLATACTS